MCCASVPMRNTGRPCVMDDYGGVWSAGRGSTGMARRRCTRAGWVRVGLSVYWQRGHKERWILLSDLSARVATSRRRARGEAMDEECKTRGWQVEATKLRDQHRLNRLLAAVWLAVGWMQQTGMRVMRAGVRPRYDRRERRDMSVQQLGRCHHLTLLDGGRPPVTLSPRPCSVAFRVALVKLSGREGAGGGPSHLLLQWSQLW